VNRFSRTGENQLSQAIESIYRCDFPHVQKQCDTMIFSHKLKKTETWRKTYKTLFPLDLSFSNQFTWAESFETQHVSY